MWPSVGSLIWPTAHYLSSFLLFVMLLVGGELPPKFGGLDFVG